ncbi:glycoside hydrolase [Acidobacteria bacterium Mor1]|nr:glycoside hydrolase [Acidobacteria bacterium Mor1]
MSRFGDNYHFGVIGNGRSCALIDPDSRIVFCCLPDFDSGTAFASLLDEHKGGSFGIEMVDGRAVDQNYQRNTNILVTRFEGPSGAFQVVDFMPRYATEQRVGGREPASDVVRVLQPLRGTPRVRVHYDPKLDYGMFDTESTVEPGRLKSTTQGLGPGGDEIYESLYLYTNLEAEGVKHGTEQVLAGERYLLLSYHDKVQRIDRDLVQLMLQRTRSYWLLWSARTNAPTMYRNAAMRSALTLKMFQFDPTGAFVAAATTSLPETIGETRNWDYRFCWIRDASMTVSVLNKIGHTSMAHEFVDWMLRTVPTKDDALQIMYGLRGEKQLTEQTLDHLSGYQGSAPVRIGNAAYHQVQHDIYGVLLDVIWQDIQNRVRTPESLDRAWTQVRTVVRTVERTWHEPDRGIWEIRGDKRHFVFSKVLCWVAVDRGIRIARLLGKDAWADQQVELLERIHAQICEHGWSDSAGAFVQAYGSDDLDASNLLLAEYGFIAADDPRFVSTVERIVDELSRDELIFRYKNADDFGMPRSAFGVCSFWMVKALAAIGRKRDARKRFEKLLTLGNRHGLYGEDFDFLTKRQLGNFPQAYCHLALIDCALMLSEGLDEDERIQA